MGQGEDAVAFARSQIGKPYRFGAVGPAAYDCSGLVVAAYKHASPPKTLPHWTGALITVGKEVAKSDLQIGDLVFPDSGHVQLYSGNGNVVEAAEPGTKVRETSMWGFWRARRVDGSGSGSNTGAIVGGILEELPNPLDPAFGSLELVRSVGKTVATINNPKFWARIGQGIVGGGLILVGLLYLNRRPLMALAGSVARTTGVVAESVAGGLGFGVGAGLSGDNRPLRTPRAPAPAVPVTAVPVTSPLPPEFGPPTARGVAPVPTPTPPSPPAARKAPRKRAPAKKTGSKKYTMDPSKVDSPSPTRNNLPWED